MGATTKSITGLFANACGRKVCDRIVREHFATGHGTRSAAAQGYLSLSLRSIPLWGLRHLSWLNQAGDQAQWLLKRLGGQLSSALSNLSGLFPSTSSVLKPARCPASSKPQVMEPRPLDGGRQRLGVGRFHG